MKTTDDEVKEYQERNGMKLDAHSRATLKAMLERENRFWENEQRDFLRGYDDGEPQTTVDFNHFEN